MPEITLTEDQARVVAAALQPVQVRDPAGQVIAVIPPLWTEEEIREIDRRWQEKQFSDCCTTAELRERLRGLGQA